MLIKQSFMKKMIGSVMLLAVCISCSRQQYVVANMQGQRLPIVAADYTSTNREMKALVSHYKVKMDKEMNEVIGTSTQDMTYGRPESLLTNLTSDVMQAYGEKYTNRACDLACMNVHGHRANLAKGNITIGNIFEIYSFDNTLVVLTLKGSDLLQIFDSYAKIGGAGLSSTARLVIKDEKLISATVKGLPVDQDKIYTIVTLDYLADGNDGMDAFKKALEVIEPGITVRDAMLKYIKEKAAQGEQISSVLDGRITIEK